MIAGARPTIRISMTAIAPTSLSIRHAIDAGDAIRLKYINQRESADWRCIKCGTEHDRDINAAKIIQQAGERLGVEAGDGNRSVRRTVRVARPMKRG